MIYIKFHHGYVCKGKMNICGSLLLNISFICKYLEACPFYSQNNHRWSPGLLLSFLLIHPSCKFPSSVSAN